MRHQSVYRSSGVSEQKQFTSCQPETPDHSPQGTAGASKQESSLIRAFLDDLEAPVNTCPLEGCNRTLIRGKYPKWPNQYDRSRWKKVLVCPRHGPVREIWENSAKEVGQ